MGRPRRTLSTLVAALLLCAAAGGAADRSSFEDQLANLRSPNAKTRAQAAEALGRSGRKEAIPALVAAVGDPEPKVRKKVVGALRAFKDPAVLEGLLVALDDEEKALRDLALDGLLELYVEPDSRGPLASLLRLFSRPRDAATPPIEPFLEVDPAVVEGIEKRLRDEEPSLRRKAAFALGLLRAEAAVDSLAVALADPDAGVRREAVEALGRIGTDTAGEALVAALSDPEEKVRREAIRALGAMRFRAAAAELLRVFEAERGKALGDEALAALARMGAPEARGVFYEMMTAPSAERRRWAVEGLGRLGDRHLVAGLTKDFLREPDPDVQLAYCFALARLGRPEFVDRLALSLPDPKRRDLARRYLVELGTPLLPELVTYLSDPVPAVRRYMVQVLMEIGDPAAIPYLEPLLADPNRDVADVANRAIARLERARMAAASRLP